MCLFVFLSTDKNTNKRVELGLINPPMPPIFLNNYEKGAGFTICHCVLVFMYIDVKSHKKTNLIVYDYYL